AFVQTGGDDESVHRMTLTPQPPGSPDGGVAGERKIDDRGEDLDAATRGVIDEDGLGIPEFGGDPLSSCTVENSVAACRQRAVRWRSCAREAICSNHGRRTTYDRHRRRRTETRPDLGRTAADTRDR